MNNNNDIQQNDFLKDLFDELPLEKVSDTFTDTVISKVEKIQYQKKRKLQFISILLPTCGFLIIILLASLIFYFTGIQIAEIEFDFNKFLSDIALSIKQNTLFFMIGFVVLVLLIIDLAFRNHLNQKKKLQNS